MPFDFPWLNKAASTPTPTPTPNPNPSKPNNPNPFLPIQTHLTSFLSSLPLPRAVAPPWARIPSPSPSAALPVAEIEDRLAGVPVYALANSAQEFILVSKTHRGGGGDAGGGVGGSARHPPALGMLCFRREDANMLLAQMGDDMRAGSTVVPVALNKVVQLKSDGVAFRFLPDPSQVANAIKLMQDGGEFVNEGFPGVPVFQSRSLVLRNDNKRYRPVFFRKEDLDKSLHRASSDQQKPIPAVRIGDTQVSSLEDIITSMKDSSSSKWDDAVFVPPGFDIAIGSEPSPLNK
ncbi:protein TIC 22-like, chloroplastic isoform X1 [Hordeum vulgare subsp. vulgare]|uniref:protein TIC 22-like, chloroplastic isoform X1 n=1 Tax=Hordeum vulgare subsp. vulgare TaxID=112509 RepID=UPI001B85AE72|nr:protein TIC 22-like, chloroplastic isoform X1 [Hordeum vulgare subsp. vulgare]